MLLITDVLLRELDCKNSTDAMLDRSGRQLEKTHGRPETNAEEDRRGKQSLFLE